ncbi:hypothetical protein C8R44DRAFT_739821 [Mycena epipterygia]|nr:hypothetical protein C8R44DRAFT_739821 [Mycena epipterygia]
MSQSGNAPLAHQDTSNALPPPSQAPPDPPIDTTIPQHSPRTLIATICNILAETKLKKNPTIASYSVLFNSLDALDRLLDNSDHIEALLKTFKADLLAEVAAIVLRAVPTPTAAKSCEVLVLLDRATKILTLPTPEIKARVESSISAAGSEQLKGVALRGIKNLPRSRLLVAVDLEKSATLLKHAASLWVPKLAKGGSLIVPRCRIIVDTVPLTFNPALPLATQDLYACNRGTIANLSVIAEIRWLNPKVLRDPKKKISSLLVTLTDVPSADYSISCGLAIESTICYPHRYEEPPLFCFNSQEHGHIQHHCKKVPACVIRRGLGGPHGGWSKAPPQAQPQEARLEEEGEGTQ